MTPNLMIELAIFFRKNILIVPMIYDRSVPMHFRVKDHMEVYYDPNGIWFMHLDYSSALLSILVA